MQQQHTKTAAHHAGRVKEGRQGGWWLMVVDCGLIVVGVVCWVGLIYCGGVVWLGLV
jgi:hypothetical protein